jgi:hypothetical protein
MLGTVLNPRSEEERVIAFNSVNKKQRLREHERWRVWRSYREGTDKLALVEGQLRNAKAVYLNHGGDKRGRPAQRGDSTRTGSIVPPELREGV